MRTVDPPRPTSVPPPESSPETEPVTAAGPDDPRAPASTAAAQRPAPLAAVFALLRPHRATLAGTTLLGLCSAALALAQPILAMRTINATLLGRPVATLAAWLVVLFLATAVVSAVQSYLLQRGGEALVLQMRLGLVHRLLRLRMPEYDRLRTGDLLARVGADTTLLRAVVANGLVSAVTGLASLAGAVGLMLWLDWYLFVFVAASVLLGASIVGVVLIGIRKWSERAQGRVGMLIADLDRALGAMRTVRAARAEERETARIGERARGAYEAGIRVARREAAVGPAVSLAANGSFLLVLGLGGARVAGGHLDIGQFVAFLLYVSYLLMPLVSVFVGAVAVQKGRAALRRIDEVMVLPLEEPDGPRPAPATPDAAADTPALELRAVRFGYAPGREVLDGLSFVVPRHRHTALVGASGAGKTTVLSLAQRFYEVSAGQILLDGRDIAAVPRHELRAAVGYVQQETPLLAGTLRDNLTYACPDASDDDLAEVLRLTNLETLVDRLPEGLDTEVGEHGGMLSGGERQRVAIARALLPRPRLLLLDEPTAHLDTANEEALARLLRDISASCTVLTVAHRDSTIRAADQIIMIEAGRVAEVDGGSPLSTGCQDLAVTALRGPGRSPVRGVAAEDGGGALSGRIAG
ncbi:ABC transporter ATP-binding protein [Micromonospora sp. NPDC004336]